jgi:hypothetical protein
MSATLCPEDFERVKKECEGSIRCVLCELFENTLRGIIFSDDIMPRGMCKALEIDMKKLVKESFEKAIEGVDLW